LKIKHCLLLQHGKNYSVTFSFRFRPLKPWYPLGRRLSGPQWVLGAISPRIKWPEHSPPSSAEIKNGGAIPALHSTPSWHGASRHMDNFTLTAHYSYNNSFGFVTKQIMFEPLQLPSQQMNKGLLALRIFDEGRNVHIP
jgi:hypothetical protein